MKLRKLVLALIAAAPMAFVTPATANTLTYQGVTFETLAVDSDTLMLNIINATVATGDWAGVGFLKAFEIKGIGDVTSASLAGWTANVANGLSASALGCAPPGGTPGACFSSSPAFALSPLMSFTIDFGGTNLNFDAPHLKVQFLTNYNDTSKTGSLLSQTIPAIPEPEIYAMMAVGLGFLGWAVRRKRVAEAVAA